MEQTMKHLWVIEIKFYDRTGWAPTVGVALTRKSAKEQIKRWRGLDRKPWLNEDKFRIRKYIPDDKS